MYLHHTFDTHRARAKNLTGTLEKMSNMMFEGNLSMTDLFNNKIYDYGGDIYREKKRELIDDRLRPGPTGLGSIRFKDVLTYSVSYDISKIDLEMGFASAFTSDPFPFHLGPITTFTK